MAETALEELLFALEPSGGGSGGSTAPTTYVNGEGVILPKKSRKRALESRGALVANYRSKVVRTWSEWTWASDLDLNLLPSFLSLAAKGGVTPTTPTNAVLARLWTHVPTLLADDLKSAVLWWGDPLVQVWRALFAKCDELKFGSVPSADGLTTFSMKGLAWYPTKVSAPTLPAQITGPLIAPQNLDVWLDLASGTIGTTPLLGRVLSVEHTLTTGMTYKYANSGAAGLLNYARTGRKARIFVVTKIIFELLDTAQYDQWDAETVVALRVRHNGPLIEHIVSPSLDFYNYVEVDGYGPFDPLAWGVIEGSNRTLELTLEAEYNATAGYDGAIRVQNTRLTLA